MRLRDRGLSLTEVLVSLLLTLMAFGMLYLSWQRSRQLSSLTRHRAAAILASQSLLEEIRAHPYGTEAPLSWAEPNRAPMEYWVDGRKQAVTLRQKVTCKNGAFVGQSQEDQDEVTITMEWDRAGAAAPQRLVVTVPVWRP